MKVDEAVVGANQDFAAGFVAGLVDALKPDTYVGISIYKNADNTVDIDIVDEGNSNKVETH